MNKRFFISFFLIFTLLHFIPLRIGYAKNYGEEENLILVGTGAFKDGFYDIAEKELTQLTRDFPSHANLYDVYYLLGKTFLFKKKLKEAKASFMKIANEKKNFEEMDHTLFWLAEIELKLGNPEGARRFLLSILNRFPKFEWLDSVYYLLGLIEFESGHLSPAESYFQKVSHLSKNNEVLQPSFFWLGVLSFRQGRFEGALDYFKKLSESTGAVHPLYLKYTLFWLGETQLKSGRLEEAKKTYQAFYEHYKNDSLAGEALWKIGFCHYRLGGRKDAIDLFQSFKIQFKGSPFIPYTQFLLGKMFLSLGDYSSSLKELNLLFTKSPENSLWGISLLSSFWNYTYQGDAEGASKVSQRLQKMNHFEDEKMFLQWLNAEMTFAGGRISDALPYYFNVLNTRFREKALFQIGKGYFLENKDREAITNFDILFLEYPNSKYSEEGLFLKGESLLRMGSLDRALESYEQILRRDQKNCWQVFALTQMGNLYTFTKENSKAEKSFKRILQNFPDHPLSYYALFKLGNLFFRRNDIVEALHYYSQILKGKKLQLWGETHFLLGEIFYQEGKYEKALGSFEIAVRYLKESSPWFFLTCLEMGNLQKRWGRFEEAKNFYTTVLHQTKDEELKKAAAELLNLMDSR